MEEPMAAKDFIIEGSQYGSNMQGIRYSPVGISADVLSMRMKGLGCVVYCF